MDADALALANPAPRRCDGGRGSGPGRTGRPGIGRRHAGTRPRGTRDQEPRAGRCQRQGAGPLRPGRRRHQDVLHGGQRGFSPQGGEVQGPPQPALEVGRRLLRQARRDARQGEGSRLAACARGLELRAGRPDRQGRPQGRCARRTPRRPRGAGGDGGRARVGRRDEGRSRPELDGDRHAC